MRRSVKSDSLDYSYLDHLRFEKLISDISARIVNVSQEDVDREINLALEDVSKFFKVARCGLLRTGSDPKQAFVSHSWYDDGREKVSGEINIAALFPAGYELVVVKGKHLSLARTSDLPSEMETDRQSYAARGVLSVIDIPLSIAGRSIPCAHAHCRSHRAVLA